MNEYFSTTEQKIAVLNKEIAEFEALKDAIDKDDPDWERVTEEQRRLFKRYGLEINLRYEVIVLEGLITKRRTNEEKGRYDLIHLEEAIRVLKLYPEYVPPSGYSPDYWGGEIIDAYRNQGSDRAVWLHVRVLVGKDTDGRRWSEVATEEQLLFVLTMMRRQLNLFAPGFTVQSWREGLRVMILGTLPDDETKEDGYRVLRQILDPINKQLQAFWTIKEFREALNNL